VPGLDHVVLHIAADTVLRTEESRQLNVVSLRKYVGDVPKVGQYRSLIADECDSLSADEVKFLVEYNFDTWSCSGLHGYQFESPSQCLGRKRI
jgi:hypothetical protein